MFASVTIDSNLQPDAESSWTTPTFVEYERRSRDTHTGLRHHEADNSSSYYSRPPGQLILARGYPQSASATGATGLAAGGGIGIRQAKYFGVASVETARSDPEQQNCVPWEPPASTNQPTSQEVTAQVTAQPATNSRPRRGVARPLSYQEPSLNIKMRK